MDVQSRDATPRIAVVTAMVGGKDRLLDPTVVAPGVDYLAFTDRPIECVTWQRREAPLWSDDPRFARRRNAKLPKILTTLMLPEYDYSIWLDANVTLRADPRKIVSRHLSDRQACLAVFGHPTRDCVYAEAKAVLSLRLDRPATVKAQMNWYREHGLPPHAGLAACRFLVRRHGPRTMEMDLAWWEQICRFSSRDQLSLPFVLHRLGTPIRLIEEGTTRRNDLYDLRDHEFEDASHPLWRRALRALRGRKANPGPEP